MVNGVTGQSTAYALDSLYDRGYFFVNPGEQVYEGQLWANIVWTTTSSSYNKTKATNQLSSGEQR